MLLRVGLCCLRFVVCLVGCWLALLCVACVDFVNGVVVWRCGSWLCGKCYARMVCVVIVCCVLSWFVALSVVVGCRVCVCCRALLLVCCGCSCVSLLDVVIVVVRQLSLAFCRAFDVVVSLCSLC